MQLKMKYKNMILFICNTFNPKVSYPQSFPVKGPTRTGLQSVTMIKFISLKVLGLSHRIPGKIKNVAYSYKISALVLEIFKFQKSVKYANERTDDVIHSTQKNIKYRNRPISDNYLAKTIKTWFPWQLTLFPVSLT